MRPELMNGSACLHGGVTATLADVAVGMALARHLGRPRAATTVEMKINYLRPVAHGKITARSHLVKVGARLCCGRVEIFDGEKRPVAAALITYMILDGKCQLTRMGFCTNRATCTRINLPSSCGGSVCENLVLWNRI